MRFRAYVRDLVELRDGIRLKNGLLLNNNVYTEWRELPDLIVAPYKSAALKRVQATLPPTSSVMLDTVFGEDEPMSPTPHQPSAP